MPKTKNEREDTNFNILPLFKNYLPHLGQKGEVVKLALHLGHSVNLSINIWGTGQ